MGEGEEGVVLAEGVQGASNFGAKRSVVVWAGVEDSVLVWPEASNFELAAGVEGDSPGAAAPERWASGVGREATTKSPEAQAGTPVPESRSAAPAVRTTLAACHSCSRLDERYAMQMCSERVGYSSP